MAIVAGTINSATFINGSTIRNVPAQTTQVIYGSTFGESLHISKPQKPKTTRIVFRIPLGKGEFGFVEGELDLLTHRLIGTDYNQIRKYNRERLRGQDQINAALPNEFADWNGHRIRFDFDEQTEYAVANIQPSLSEYMLKIHDEHNKPEELKVSFN